eukprot:COSAG02_NODE_914_length_15990_cov_9.617897_11_plen_106_part_00
MVMVLLTSALLGLAAGSPPSCNKENICDGSSKGGFGPRGPIGKNVLFLASDGAHQHEHQHVYDDRTANAPSSDSSAPLAGYRYAARDLSVRRKVHAYPEYAGARG